MSQVEGSLQVGSEASVVVVVVVVVCCMFNKEIKCYCSAMYVHTSNLKDNCQFYKTH